MLVSLESVIWRRDTPPLTKATHTATLDGLDLVGTDGPDESVGRNRVAQHSSLPLARNGANRAS